MPNFLYRKEKQVLEFLIQFQRKHSYSPTLVEIATATGYRSVSGIHTIIRSLVEKGYVQKVNGNSRVLAIKENTTLNSFVDELSIKLPLMGFIGLDQTLEPHQDLNATFQVSASLIKGTNVHYILQVKGDSMKHDDFLHNDYLIIERVIEATNGDTVVALLGNTLATVKRYYYGHSGIVLTPVRSQIPPLYPTQIRIQGKIVAVIRKFSDI